MKPTLCSFPCLYCPKVCCSLGGLTRHRNTCHPILSSDSDSGSDARTTTLYHPTLDARPVSQTGEFLPKYTNPPPRQRLSQPFDAFLDRLAFDWAHYHFVECASSEAKINKGLDLWLAAKVQATGDPNCTGLPWSCAADMYATIDEVQVGHSPFYSVEFKYNGPLPRNPPAWMMQSYELYVRDVRAVVHSMLDTPDFENQFNSTPYRQFRTKSRDHVWSNLLSGDWAWIEADKIAEDPQTHGAMLVPVVSGLDKTTVSVATGHQEFHPFYVSAGNLTNAARRGHGNGVVPVAFLPIPKVSKRQKKQKDFKRFVRQMYHACIARIFTPLKPGMKAPEVMRCPDGHFRRAVYSIGPIIADYPEQVWLAGIVQNWCPKCFARPEDLDNPNARRRTQCKSEVLLRYFDPSILWDKFGLRDDVVPFTYDFPRADIHQLIAPDLLHQLIKGTFKDHLVTWINDYLRNEYGENRSLEIIEDIDRRISAVPIYPGLRRFKEGRDFQQWTGDDSKALMKVYIAAIVGYVPDTMVQCLSAFMEVCYILRRNAITASALGCANHELEQFYSLREIFIETGTRNSISLPRQHSLMHFIKAVQLFGSPNGLCSSITESRHIEAVKKPWRRTNKNEPLLQMLQIIVRQDKMATLRRTLIAEGKLRGTTAMHMAMEAGESGRKEPLAGDAYELDDRSNDVGPVPGPRVASSVLLSRKPAPGYPKDLHDLAEDINEPQLVPAFLDYLFSTRYPSVIPPAPIEAYIDFTGKVHVHHSATARFYAPSDMCGTGGMQRQMVRCNRSWQNRTRMDTVLVAQSDEPGMKGMMIAQLRLLFSFHDPTTNMSHACALVNWFPTIGNEPDPVTGMWKVHREEEDGEQPLQVIPLASVVRGAHLLPDFGNGRLPEGLSYTDALDAWQQYFVNSYVDYHVHELLTL
ncbi:hypothetical protein BKA70DRAFT_1104154 [Coprinopsis sp. MPI-PUGE-AT-0042]|nr:hypothetical protein BKA70DRAFT_1104154 [Coprinopsis sp. MPI-PUGE-AT-0042]